MLIDSDFKTLLEFHTPSRQLFSCLFFAQGRVNFHDSKSSSSIHYYMTVKFTSL